ncbi:MAG: hypothetical protein ACXWT1_02825 [Methylobacter sp.]
MIDTPSKDMALEALLDAAREEAPDLPTELIKAIYQVEKIHQFSPEDKAAIDALQKLIDEELSNFQRGNQ